MIAKELGVDANNRELYVKLGNGHKYRYLLNNGTVDAVYGITQGKWLITSER